MLRYTFGLVSAILLIAAFVAPATAGAVANVNMYGYPMVMGLVGDNGASVPGAAYTMNNAGIEGLSDVTSRYGVISASSVSMPSTQSNYGYLGSDLSGISLGVDFGWPTATHDSATTAYAKDLAYEACLDNAAIAFPGFGVGSLGVSFPSLTSNKADIKYVESVRFTLTTESDSMPISGFGYPLGLGLGYLGVGVNGGLGSSGIGTPFYSFSGS